MCIKTLIGACLLAALMAHAQAPAKKVLRYAFEVAETSLDPVKLNDLYSRTLTAHVFEGLYTYDHLARPVKIKPLVADGMPQTSGDFRVWTIRIKPGIHFADDPAFKGAKRELVAQDFVYTFKRYADPANKAPSWTSMEAEGIVGLSALRKQAIDDKKPFDYEREIEGVRALDRYTVQFKLAEPRPRFIETLAGGDIGAVAREVVAFYGEQVEAHPVGTGPFKLVQWRRSSFIAFERNPGYRERYYDAEPAADDAEGQALLARFKGRRLPMVDRVEISIIEEEQPRWLSFVNGEADLAYRVGYQFVNQAMPNGRVAPNLTKRGIRGYRIVEPAGNSYLFNMDDPTVGGYGPERVALRRAIGLGMDARRVIDYAYSGQGVVANGPLLPWTSAFDPAFRSEFGQYDPARAKALLDLYGYKDVDGDGWREMPDGSPLVLKVNTQADQRSRKIAEVMNKNVTVLGIRSELVVAQWPENLKAARSGKYQVWYVGQYAAALDSSQSLQRFDSRQIGGQNMARFKNPQVDALYDRVKLLPDGPERAAAFIEIQKIALAYMPYKFTLNRLSVDMSYPQVIGYRRPLFWLDFWQYLDIDDSKRPAR
ncbi:MAG: ABC transporter substrate-binding protein [Burkholderiales bacterium]